MVARPDVNASRNCARFNTEKNSAHFHYDVLFQPGKRSVQRVLSSAAYPYFYSGYFTDVDTAFGKLQLGARSIMLAAAARREYRSIDSTNRGPSAVCFTGIFFACSLLTDLGPCGPSHKAIAYSGESWKLVHLNDSAVLIDINKTASGAHNRQSYVCIRPRGTTLAQVVYYGIALLTCTYGSASLLSRG